MIATTYEAGVEASVVNTTNGQLLGELLGSYGIPSTEDQRALLLRHLYLVLEKNTVMNLTRIQSVGDALVLHLLDSALFLPELEKTQGRVLDIGTGAGFPGIPLAVMTDRRYVLMDSVRKKVLAVEEFAKELGLEGRVSVTSDRAEAHGLRRQGAYGAVVARAVAPAVTLVEYAQPLLRMGGRLIVSKGRIEESELASAKKGARLCGMVYIKSVPLELPDDRGHREILVFEKKGKGSVKLPRRIGEAKTHPLA